MQQYKPKRFIFDTPKFSTVPHPEILATLLSLDGSLAQLLAWRMISQEVESSNPASDSRLLVPLDGERHMSSPCMYIVYKFHQLHGNETLSSCCLFVYVHSI